MRDMLVNQVGLLMTVAGFFGALSLVTVVTPPCVPFGSNRG